MFWRYIQTLRTAPSILQLLAIAIVCCVMSACSAESNLIIDGSVGQATSMCPTINTFSLKTDLNHWFSPSENNADDKVMNQCNSCLDPENRDQKACLVDQFLRSDHCSGNSCSDTQGSFIFYRDPSRRLSIQHDLRYKNHTLFPRAKGEGCRFIVWALDPVIGVEDGNRQSGINYWREAYLASQNLVNPSYPKQFVAMLIQSALTRGQHQLHIHIGTLFVEYQQAISQLKLDSSVVQYVRVNGYDFSVKYVADAIEGEPYTGESPFDVVVGLLPAGEQDMAKHGILTATAPNMLGIFVMVASRLERDQLNYVQSHECELARY